RIAPGYKADIVFLDLHHINCIPINDPVNQIVHTEDGSGVHSVMVGGRLVVENRKLLTVDLAKLAAQGAAPHPPLRREPPPPLNQMGWTAYPAIDAVLGHLLLGSVRLLGEDFFGM